MINTGLFQFVQNLIKENKAILFSHFIQLHQTRLTCSRWWREWRYRTDMTPNENSFCFIVIIKLQGHNLINLDYFSEINLSRSIFSHAYKSTGLQLRWFRPGCRDFSGLAVLLGAAGSEPALLTCSSSRRRQAAMTRRSRMRWSWSALHSSVSADPLFMCEAGETVQGTQTEEYPATASLPASPLQHQCPRLRSLSPDLWNNTRVQDTAQKL